MAKGRSLSASFTRSARSITHRRAPVVLMLAALLVALAWLLTLSADARAASSPSIDPLIQGSALLPGETGVGEMFGRSVALSGDGDTALVGASSREAVGGAWVYTRSGTTWTQQGGKLTGGDEVGAGHFGRSVALSQDGNTALIGGPGDEENRGAAWVFTRSGSTWTQQGPKLTDAGKGTARGRFGRSVALSGEGDTALIGSPAAYGGRGAGWAFTRSGTTWSEEGEPLEGEGDVGARLGVSVALSGNGETALLGGPHDQLGVGAAWLFAFSGASWQQQGGKLTGEGESGDGQFGYSVALSGEGDSAIIGGPRDDGQRGAEWLFTGSGGVLHQQGSKLAGEEEGGEGEFGYASALAGEGNTALVGAPRFTGHLGSASLLGRSGTGWTLPGEVLGGAGVVRPAWFGASVALSADGSVALVGGPRDQKKDGAVWSFIGSSSAPLPEPTPEGLTVTTTTTDTDTMSPPSGGAPGGVGASGVLGSKTVGLPPPVLGKTTNLRLISGIVLVKVPGSPKFVLLSAAVQVPFGTIIDARHGRVALTTARLHGGTQTMTFFDGEFVPTQRRNGLVVASLFGGNFSVCPTARERSHQARVSSAHASSKHVVRKLWAEGHGSYSTKGDYASGAVLGTRWLTEDRCDGTLIHVATDRVSVTNLVTHHHIKISAPHSYLAKAR